jgi:hypothetical protein
MNNISYNLIPPLQSADELPNCMFSIQCNVCTTNPLWLVTNPLALIVLLVVCSAITYEVYLGVNGIVDALAGAPILEAGIGNVFGMTQIFAYCVFASFWFAVIPHGFEAAIAVHYCLTTLRLDIGPTFLWGFLIFLDGYPIFNELQDLLAIQKSYDLKLHTR